MCRFSSIDSLNFFGWMISYGCRWLMMLFARELKPETKTNNISFFFRVFVSECYILEIYIYTFIF
jgi:hypothetical protein